MSTIVILIAYPRTVFRVDFESGVSQKEAQLTFIIRDGRWSKRPCYPVDFRSADNAHRYFVKMLNLGYMSRSEFRIAKSVTDYLSKNVGYYVNCAPSYEHRWRQILHNTHPYFVPYNIAWDQIPYAFGEVT